MRLLNGLIFGAGTGFITAGTLGLANEYAPVINALGIILVLFETSRILYQTHG